ncbi:MAG TPA: amino acid permease [Gemmatimonadota bacterium]|nr:amino acid permease [Gemmatimonadota bacterium]
MSESPGPRLAREVGLFDATMIVMGGIVGAGIFINPYVVAQHLDEPLAILGAWALGGLIALVGAFVYAELAARLPEVGGQYAYLREAWHPLLGFLYGWVLLLVIQTGGMAAVAITFAAYFRELTGLSAGTPILASCVLAGLAAVNCLGVRAGSRAQSALMVLKVVAILTVVVAGAWFLGRGGDASPAGPSSTRGFLDGPSSGALALGAAMVPVLFAYGGWQTANFVAGEVREPRRNLPRALVLGVTGVVLLYLAMNFVCVQVLGAEALAGTTTPASAVMEAAFGRAGARFIAVGIAISTLGFLSQSMLTAPRVYFAMARDRTFFRAVAWVDPRRRVPTVAILLQAAMAIVIALSGRYEQILGYVVSMDFLFFGLTATCLFVLRRREERPEAGGEGSERFARVPGHPVTTVLFIAACWLVVLASALEYPGNTAIGMAILLAGIPAYRAWSRGRAVGGNAP